MKGGLCVECEQWNEIRNGRLAMVAFLGFVAQHAATGKVGQPHGFACMHVKHRASLPSMAGSWVLAS